MTRQAVFLEMHHTLKGDYPLTIPLAEGVDLTALTDGDDAPMFLTLPIAAETTSRNGVKYQHKDVMQIVHAINNRQIIGQKGHLTEAERSHRFDTPALFWVGATLTGDRVGGDMMRPKSPTPHWSRAFLLPHHP